MATQDIVTIVLFDAGATANNNMLEQMQLLEAMRVAQSGRAGEVNHCSFNHNNFWLILLF